MSHANNPSSPLTLTNKKGEVIFEVFESELVPGSFTVRGRRWSGRCTTVGSVYLAAKQELEYVPAVVTGEMADDFCEWMR